MTQIIDLGKLRFHFAQEYVAATIYETNDVVKYGGNVYCYTYALREAGVLPTDKSHWALMLEGVSLKGSFDPAVFYKINEAVVYGGRVYVAVQDGVGNIPPNDTYWSLLVDGVQYEGVYVSATAYQKNDMVTYGADMYVAKVDTTGNLPTNATYWTKIVSGIAAKGVYNAGTSYLPNDVVGYGAGLYRAKVATTNNLPSNAAYWEPLITGVATKGAYVGATAYVKGDVVSYGPTLYIAKGDTTGNIPTNAAFWDVYLTGVGNQGLYAAGTTYQQGAIVNYGGNSYIAKGTTLGNAPPNAAYWDVLAYGTKPRGPWVTATQYAVNDIVTYGGNTFLCLTNHASATFAGDAANWQKYNSGIRNRNGWATGVAYLPDDIFTDGTNTYQVLVAHTSTTINADKTSGNISIMVAGTFGVAPMSALTIGQLLTNDGLNSLWKQFKVHELFGAQRALATDFSRPKRVGVKHHIGDAAGTALATGATVAGSIYAIPFSVTHVTTLAQIGMTITTASSGNFKVGVYDSQEVNGNVVPNAPLAQISGSVAVVTDVQAAVNQVLNPGELYWFVFGSAVATTFRGIPIANQYPAFGRAATAVLSMLVDVNTSNVRANFADASALPSFAGADNWAVAASAATPSPYFIYG